MRSTLAFLAILVCSTFIYLYPGSQALLEKRTDVFMSDGTDPTSLAMAYDRLLKVWDEHPSRLFYGAVYEDSGDGDRGVALWFPWDERWMVVLSSYLFPLEQLSTAFIFGLFLLNGLAMFLLGRALGWSSILSGTLGFAWAINCFTRARAKVHGALVGQFHLPLIFLGLVLVARGKSWRSLALASVAFFVAATTAHYYLITSIFLSPFFVAFLFVQPEFSKKYQKILIRLSIAVMPAVLLLGWTRYMALPSEAKMSAEDSMNTQWEDPNSISPFLTIYRAHPIDFLGGDISLTEGIDINPLRGWVSDYIRSNLEMSNYHERTNGIRWTILGLSIFALLALVKGQLKKEKVAKANIIYFLALGLFGLWMSMGVESPINAISPGYWIYSIFPKVRVASRAGIILHFSLLMICGFFLSQWKLFKQIKWAALLFAGLMLIEYLPFQTVPMAPIAPAYAELNRKAGPCGTGMFFPFINPWTVSLEHYSMLQRMRGSDCSMVNQMTDPKKVIPFIQRFPPSINFIESLNQNMAAKLDLLRLAKCVPLTWIAFHPAVPSPWAASVCAELGWVFGENLLCISPDKGAIQKTEASQCL